jgi:hypothetical protein
MPMPGAIALNARRAIAPAHRWAMVQYSGDDGLTARDILWLLNPKAERATATAAPARAAAVPARSAR